MPAMRVALAVAAVLAVVLVSCYQEPVAIKQTPSPSLPITDLSSFTLAQATPAVPPTAQATPAPTPPPQPTPSAIPTQAIAFATPAPDCINGWRLPAADSAEYQEALGMLNGTMDVAGPWNVEEMRYFTGPDVPWILEPHYDTVYYWYVRASLASDPSFRGRWLLEKRTELIKGVSAVAPYTTTGYSSPDWTGFVGEGPPQAYIGLPGEWSGIAYDFVTGDGDSGQPGLPDEVIGCLSGT